MKITNLFIKQETGKSLIENKELYFENLKIKGQGETQPFRSVLITSADILKKWNINPGDFRENIVIDDVDLSSFKSGDEIAIGDTLLRITFLCEPCKKMSHIGTVEKLTGYRGVLCDIIQDGMIKINDEVKISGQKKYSQIPAEYFKRIEWFLESYKGDIIFASDLLWNSGVSKGLVRVLPQILEKYDIKFREKVMYKKYFLEGK